MRARKLVLGPAAVGLVVANLVVVGVVIASVLVARRAWELREAALAAAAQAQAIAAPAARGLPLTAVVHAPLRKLGATAMDRMLLSASPPPWPARSSRGCWSGARGRSRTSTWSSGPTGRYGLASAIGDGTAVLLPAANAPRS
jgi:hypothetical protein